ncbi:MAG: shikimate dehydrogenase [Armatimonadetes bacterium CG2_30_59_28]|nr:shikimate dehydrogenase [Armatimonadota bacterium]OIO93633.1 MAG: shikimate dehydrogenase [Armatimonadetes bacterium CG2_30_59_28]PIU66286.1 MAG: shikimate dehydrogenase [Armatimonadetes bacterium CG07_land_8_20_14_0_80_59_28]PIX39884.1 MAG: shikimate dehydrogenase [Armatimonadetes bacterium CG_4_8_14_3_um_filter_58_9]PIY41050.1 MAG: shikimate dehydrogenase [Armatimonadetes bacterium CG_4_10_14_3_um_filter_59_10]
MKELTSISPRTQFCAVIGNPIAHSLSPAIHNAAFQHLGLDFVYLACQVEDVEGALAGMRALSSFRGMSVTIPHKTEVMKHVDEISDVDRSIGAINTVIHEGNKLIGLGTDGLGALKALADAGVEIAGKNVLMLGTGGAARAISFPLARTTKLAELTLLDINEDLLRSLSADLTCGTAAVIKAEPLTQGSLTAAMGKADIILHCTSVGMHPHENASLIPLNLFRPGQVVFDIVYNPFETKLLTEAKARGLKTVPGVELFVNQAVLQFEQFTGVDAPVDVMRRVVLERLTS